MLKLFDIVNFALEWRMKHSCRMKEGEIKTKQKNPKNTCNHFWGLKLSNFPPGTRLQALDLEMPLSKVSGVLKLLLQSAVEVLQSRACRWVYFGEHEASAGDTRSADTHTLSLSLFLYRPSVSTSPSIKSNRHNSKEEQFSAFLNDCSFEDWCSSTSFIIQVFIWLTPAEEVCACVYVKSPEVFLSRQLLSSTS